jgi:thiosulfate/3-mercaptopyruvate sulfurtransferase
MSLTQSDNSHHSSLGHDETLVEPDWLHEHLSDRCLRLVEVDVSSARYDDGHIRGAVLWNVYVDLKDADYRTIDRERFTALVRRTGITAESTVVLYGYAPAMGLWLLRLFGHRDVRILNCSREHWVSLGGALTTRAKTFPISDYVLAAEAEQVRASLDQVHAAIDDPGTTILDVRSAAEFSGECFWPSGASEPDGRAGHVPSAIHLPIDAVLDERGRFRDSTELTAVFAGLDLSGASAIVTYCTIGGRASTAWFVLTQLLGVDHVAVYDGSWSQWGRTPTTPVAQGSSVGAGTTPSARPFESRPTIPPSLEVTMSGLIRKSLNAPEETRTFEAGTGHLELVNLDSGPVGRATFLPGWRWSQHVKPIAGTDSCQAAHRGYFVTGRMVVVMDDGERVEYGPGDFADMSPGHDAWTVGDEPCVFIDWQGFVDYAKR